MSVEALFRQIIKGDNTAALVPGVSLSEMAKELDASALGQLTVDFLRLRLLPAEEHTDLQQQAKWVFES